MNIAILGAGNSGCALAADYAARGHEVTLIKTSHSLHDDNFSHLCATGGRMRIHEFGTDTDCVIAHLSRDVADVRGKDIVLLCTQTGYHHDVLRRVVPFLTAGQILLMIPGYLSTAYALGLHPADGVIFAEAESNFIDGRICAPGEFQVGFRNVRNPIGVYPHSALPTAKAVLDRLGTPFIYLSSVAEAALHNPNMIVHTVGAIMTIPRIEGTNGDYCMYHEAFTRSGICSRRSTVRRCACSSGSAARACRMSRRASIATASMNSATRRRSFSPTPPCRSAPRGR